MNMRVNDFKKGKKEERYLEILKIFDQNYSIYQNVKLLKEKHRINVSKDTLYNILRYYNIDPSIYLIRKKEKIKDLYNYDLTLDENLKIIRSKGIKVGRSSLNNYINE